MHGSRSGYRRAPRHLLRSAGARTAPLVVAAMLMTATPAAGAPASIANLKTQAKTAFIVRSDLPRGWTSTKNTASGGTIGFGVPTADQQLASCIGVPVKVVQKTPVSAIGPEFVSPGDQADDVADAVIILESANVANYFVTWASGPKTASCMQSIAQGPSESKIFGGTAAETFGAVTVTPLPTRSVPAHTTGYAVAASVTEDGVKSTVYVDQVLTVKGRFVQELSFYAVGQPFPAQVQRHLESVAAARLEEL